MQTTTAAAELKSATPSLGFEQRYRMDVISDLALDLGQFALDYELEEGNVRRRIPVEEASAQLPQSGFRAFSI